MSPIAATPEPPPRPAPGPLRNGNPRGNPNLAPRCGAKARTTGCPCRAPAMPNGRCRMHGGNCRGPSTPEGRERMTAANTKHGRFSAHDRIERHHVRAFTSRNRLVCAARLLWRYLPPDMAARLGEGPEELSAPVHPSNLPYLTPQDAMPGNVKTRRGKPVPKPAGRAAERLAVRAEAAAQAPWRQAIAHARAAKRTIRQARTAWRQKQAARRNALQRDGAASPADQHATPAPPPATWNDLTPLQRELAFRMAGLRGPRGGQPPNVATPAPQAEPKPRDAMPCTVSQPLTPPAPNRRPRCHPPPQRRPAPRPTSRRPRPRPARRAHPSPAAKPKPRDATPYNVSSPPRHR